MVYRANANADPKSPMQGDGQRSVAATIRIEQELLVAFKGGAKRWLPLTDSGLAEWLG